MSRDITVDVLIDSLSDSSFRQPVDSSKGIPKAFLVSLGFHGVAALVIVNLGIGLENIQSGEKADPVSSIRVTLVERPQAPVIPEEPANTVDAGESLETRAPDEEEQALQTEQKAVSDDASEFAENSLPEPMVNEALPVRQPTRAEVARVTNAISGYVETLPANLNKQWVENCRRYRNRHGTRDCPDNALAGFESRKEAKAAVENLFARINQDANYARMGRKPDEEITLLSELANAGNPAAEQAKIRIAINNRYLSYLNGNISPAVSQHEVASGFANDYGRTSAPRPFQFNCKGMGKCIYDFTGFTVKKPANYVEQVPAFPSQTPLFLPSRN